MAEIEDLSGYDKRRATRIQWGCCAYCGAARGADGTLRYCRPCADRLAAKERKRRRREAKNGRCVDCGRPKGPDGTKAYCRACQDRCNARTTALFAERAAKGLCKGCGKVKVRQFRYCIGCRERWSARHRKVNQ